ACREVEREQAFVAGDVQVAAEGMEVEAFAVGVQSLEDEGAGQRGVPAERNLHRRREPAQVPAFLLRYEEGGFRKVVLRGYAFKHVVGQPAFEQADSCRVAVKEVGGEGVDYVQ